ncbi:MAG: hypothetical protein A2007_03460 [Verrucomicrobia bacterium GWC2_42_7]|nr:MAG: hypothetical protein A2007_03460 [Verrucomicrobia bacterium GWC2_42_7]
MSGRNFAYLRWVKVYRFLSNDIRFPLKCGWRFSQMNPYLFLYSLFARGVSLKNSSLSQITPFRKTFRKTHFGRLLVSPTLSSKRGFSLLEMVFAIGIFCSVLCTIFGFLAFSSVEHSRLDGLSKVPSLISDITAFIQEKPFNEIEALVKEPEGKKFYASYEPLDEKSDKLPSLHFEENFSGKSSSIEITLKRDPYVMQQGEKLFPSGRGTYIPLSIEIKTSPPVTFPLVKCL